MKDIKHYSAPNTPHMRDAIPVVYTLDVLKKPTDIEIDFRRILISLGLIKNPVIERVDHKIVYRLTITEEQSHQLNYEVQKKFKNDN